MPLPQHPDLEITFDLKASPASFLFEDSTDYSGDNLIGGFLTIVGPGNLQIYETPSGTPDFLPSDLTFSDIAIPQNTVGQVVQGDYLFTYTVFTDNFPTGLIQTLTVTFEFEAPNPEILTTIDCFAARLTSRDATDYSQNGVTPVVSRNHVIHFPPVTGQTALTSFSATQAVSYPNLYEGTYTVELSSSLLYDYDTHSVCAALDFNKEIEVQCDTSLCEIFCCLSAYRTRVERYKKQNTALYQQEKSVLLEALMLAFLYQQAVQCGKQEKAQTYFSDILELTECDGDCGCGCSEDQPQQIQPILSAATGSTNQWLTGNGIPVTSQGNDDDLYLDLASGNVFQRSSGVWSQIGNLMGSAGSRWLNGTADPNSINGSDGDFFINSTSGDFFQKVNNTWVLSGNLKGQDGNHWELGNGVPASQLGNDNDLYLDLDTGDLYQKLSGAWGAPIGNLTGPAGPAGPGANSLELNFSIPSNFVAGAWLTVATNTQITNANLSDPVWTMYERINTGNATDDLYDVVLSSKISGFRRNSANGDFEAQFLTSGNYKLVLISG